MHHNRRFNVTGLCVPEQDYRRHRAWPRSLDKRLGYFVYLPLQHINPMENRKLRIENNKLAHEALCNKAAAHSLFPILAHLIAFLRHDSVVHIP
ncbi:MAG: hypothetical protein FWH22_02275, partial [Fibromonadales bacterium]|nr:hypothetical protein [Fibromonadales bacterium]